MCVNVPRRNEIIKEQLTLTNRRCRRAASPTDRRGRSRRRDSHRGYISCSRQSRPGPSCPLTYSRPNVIIESNVYTYFAPSPGISTLENERARKQLRRAEKEGFYSRRSSRDHDDDDSLYRCDRGKKKRIFLHTPVRSREHNRGERETSLYFRKVSLTSRSQMT